MKKKENKEEISPYATLGFLKRLIGILIIAVIIAVIAVIVVLSRGTYGPTKERATIEDMYIKPHSFLVAIGVNYEKYRPPVGLSTFPNGGVPKVLEERVDLYLCDIDKQTVKLLAQIPVTKDVWVSFEPLIVGWEEDCFYCRITGHPEKWQDYNDPYVKEYYKITLEGQYEKIPESEIPPPSTTENKRYTLTGKGFRSINISYKLCSFGTSETNCSRIIVSTELEGEDKPPFGEYYILIFQNYKPMFRFNKTTMMLEPVSQE